MQRRLRQVCTAVKAKMAVASGFFCSVDVIVTRATSLNDVSFHDKYVHELLKVFSISGQLSIHRFSVSFTRRFSRTPSRRVAIKCLLLLHRLLRLFPSETVVDFRSELLGSIANGLVSLHPCCLRNKSDRYTAFVRSYARFLDEALNASDFRSREVEEAKVERNVEFSERMKEVGRVLEVLPQLQSLMDRAMECLPSGDVVRSLVVKAAMKSIVRDTFGFYEVFRREIVGVLDVLFQIPYRDCVKAFGVYKKAGLQAVELSEFYDWCKGVSVCGFYEYPFVERIPLLQIQALERFLHGMWQFTDSEDLELTLSSPSTLSLVGSRSSGSEDEGREVVGRSEYWGEEEEPLIQFGEEESDENESWEDLLEASVNTSPMMNSMSFSNYNGIGDQREGRNLMIMVYNPNRATINPFNQPWIMQDFNHGCSDFSSAYSMEGYSSTK